jgi:chromosome segregation ATPase
MESTISVVDTVDEDHVETIAEYQASSITVLRERTDKMNEMNVYSLQMYEQLSSRLERHVKLITELKNDLNQVFRMIRVLRTKCTKKYPLAHRKVLEQYPQRYEEE